MGGRQIVVSALIGIGFLQTSWDIRSFDVRRDFVATEDKAYALLPAKVIAEPHVVGFKWSPNGESLAIVTTSVPIVKEPPFPPELEKMKLDIRIWRKSDGSIGRSQTIYGPSTVSFIEWMPDSSAALVMTRTRPEKVSALADVVDFKSLRQTRLISCPATFKSADVIWETMGDEHEFIALSVSPSLPVIAISQHYVATDPETRKSWGTSRTSLLLNGGRIPVRVEDRYQWAGWTTDGRAIFLDGKQQFASDPRTSQMVAYSGTTAIEPVRTDPLKWLRPHQIPSGEGLFKTQSLALLGDPKSRAPKALVTGDASSFALSPKNSEVCFVTNGALFIREIVPVDLRAFNEVMDRHEVERVMDRAKQIASALQIYAADYQDNFPEVGRFEDDIFEYTKNRDLAKGFVYKGTRPNLGYFLAPGGRAVVYVDGSVKWVPDK